MKNNIHGLIVVLLVAPVVALAQGTFTPVPAVSGSDPGSTSIWALNDSDMIGGDYTTGGGAVTHAFIGTLGGSYTTFDYSAPGFSTVFTQVRAINNAGDAVGVAQDSAGDSREFLRTPDGTIETLVNPVTSNPLDDIGQGINSAGTIVGSYFLTPTQKAGFILSADGLSLTELQDPLAPNVTRARGINDSGTVVGTYSAGGITHGFIYNSGTYTTLDDPLGIMGTLLEGINNAGDIVGQYFDASGVDHGLLYDPATHTFTTLDAPGSTNSVAWQINNAGQVTVAGDTTSYIWSPVPLPGSLPLLGLGLAGLGIMTRRKVAWTQLRTGNRALQDG